MIDITPNNKPVADSIPVISPLLHWLSVPVLVFLRKRFGYDYLRPKLIFLTAIFCNVPLSYMVWNEPRLTPEFIDLSIFAILSSALYLIHLFVSAFALKFQRLEHGHSSGDSLLLLLVPAARRKRLEALFYIAVEPAFISVAGATIYSRPLGKLLLLLAAAVFFKEFSRSWLTSRRKQTIKDQITGATDIVPIETTLPPKISSQGKTAREIFPPNNGE